MALNNSVFVIDDCYYMLERDKYETVERFNERGWFVAKKQPKTIGEYNRLVNLSRMFVNVKYNDAVYSSDIMKELSSSI